MPWTYEGSLDKEIRLVYGSPPASPAHDVLSELPAVPSVHVEFGRMDNPASAMRLHKSRSLVDSISLRGQYC